MAEWDYWDLSGGISIDEARAFAAAEGFGLEIGRQSRFENARNAVVVANEDLKEGLVNRLLLAEEIQHGLDWPRREASRAIRRGLTVEEFHAELFERILTGFEQGRFQFLTSGDLEGLRRLVNEIR